jgi:glycerophosphoryl diester phosphodiesterase
VALGAASATAVAPDPNPWLGKRFLNIAHQGGEDEAPSSTMFAFKSAIATRGADMLELDVNLTEDGELVVIHDDTVNRTTEETRDRASGFSEVDDLTLAEVQALDAGYTFRPGGHYDKGQPASAYPYRGIRTGAVPPPPGYTAEDFRIPTLEEVLDAFPTTPINIEIKMAKNEVPGTGCVTEGMHTYCDDPVGSIPVAEALAEVLDSPVYAGRTDVIVVSFSDNLVQEFHDNDDPPQVALAPGVVGVAGYAAGGAPPNPDVAAFQVPPKQNGVAVPERLLLPPPDGWDAHGDGYAVHVWPNGEEPDGEASYARLIALGIDGYMSSQPSRLHAFLCANEIPRPDGSDRCPNATPSGGQALGAAFPARKCKKGRKGKRKATGKTSKKGKAGKRGKCVKKKGKRKSRNR